MSAIQPLSVDEAPPAVGAARYAVRAHRLGLPTAVAATIGGAIALRLPFLHTPLTADEGGYAEVARLWAHGAALYRHVWIDRPQGLLLVFRGALAAGATSVADLRLIAAGAAAVLTLPVLAAGWLMFGKRTGILAGLTAACATRSDSVQPVPTG